MGNSTAKSTTRLPLNNDIMVRRDFEYSDDSMLILFWEGRSKLKKINLLSLGG